MLNFVSILPSPSAYSSWPQVHGTIEELHHMDLHIASIKKNPRYRNSFNESLVTPLWLECIFLFALVAGKECYSEVKRNSLFQRWIYCAFSSIILFHFSDAFNELMFVYSLFKGIEEKKKRKKRQTNIYVSI